jgi:hypothetical protein
MKSCDRRDIRFRSAGYRAESAVNVKLVCKVRGVCERGGWDREFFGEIGRNIATALGLDSAERARGVLEGYLWSRGCMGRGLRI